MGPRVWRGDLQKILDSYRRTHGTARAFAQGLRQAMRFGLPAAVAGQSAAEAAHIDQAIRSAPDPRAAMEIPRSHGVRRLVVNTALILSLLLGPPALRTCSGAEWLGCPIPDRC